MKSREYYVELCYEAADRTAVLEFLEKEAPSKKTFRSEESFLNFMAGILQPKMKEIARKWRKKAISIENEVWKKNGGDPEFCSLLNESQKYREKEDFWLEKALMMERLYRANKKKNILICIRLLKSGYGEE